MELKDLLVLIVVIVVIPIWWTFVKRSKNSKQGQLKQDLKDGFVLGRYVVLIASGLVVLYFLANMDIF
jgi:preprotein translocase subunit YajC